jgi:hypothetical protein
MKDELIASIAAPATPEEAIAYADGAITAWANLVTLLAMHLTEAGTPRHEVLELLKMLHDTNQATIRSPQARASTARHLMAVYSAISSE